MCEQQVKVDRQNALHRGFAEPTSDLWFRATDAQRSRGVTVLSVSTAALAVAGIVIASPRAIYAVAAFLGLFALLGLLSTLIAVRDFARFSQSGIETRYRGRRRAMDWSEVAALDIGETTGRGAMTTMVAVLTDGKRVRLGAPRDGISVGDPDFDAKLEGIVIHCRAQAGVVQSESPLAVDAEP